MNRRRFLLTSLAALAAGPASAETQRAGKSYRLGYLSLLSASDPFPPRAAFRQGLRDLGWVESQNIVIEWRFAEGKPERLADLATELARLKVDLIFTETTLAAQAAKQATTTIPIVFNAIADPIGSGLVANLARPGGNITGSSFLGAELTGKRFELLKEAVPGLARMGVLSHRGVPTEAMVKNILARMDVAARASGVQLKHIEAQGPGDFALAFGVMAREKIGGLILVPSAMFLDERKRIVDLAAKNRLPAMFFFREFTDAGGLMSYGPNFPELGRRAATYVDRILRGAKASDLPVQQPTKFELVINLKTAKALGLTIPPSLLLRADQVIE
jgi:putative ABC transport system substrate-binding protein